MAAVTANVHSDEPHTVEAKLYPAIEGGRGEFAVLTISGVSFFVASLAEASDLVRRLDDAITEQMNEHLALSGGGS